MIAHTLMANLKTAVTAEQLFQIHKEGWVGARSPTV